MLEAPQKAAEPARGAAGRSRVSHRGFQAPTDAGVGDVSMNQTESGRKPEGSGVGILCVREARCFSVRRRLRLEDGPRLPLHAYLTAPDINASTIALRAPQVLREEV